MTMYVLLPAGSLLLTKGADFSVEDSSSMAKLLRIPTVIIGLTIVAFGTSVPELTAGTPASLSGSNDIAARNITGLNIFNLLMIVGTCDVIMPMAIDKMILCGDYLFSILAAAVVLVLSAFGHILSRLDGVILLLLFAYFLCRMVRSTLANRTAGGPREDDAEVLSPVKNVLFILGGLAVIVANGNMVVSSASSIASSLGLSETLIDLIVVAFEASPSELVAFVVTSEKGENGLTLGSVIGSNPFDTLSALAVSAAISPMKVDILSTYDTIFLIAASIITWFLARGRFKVNRREGIIMMLVCMGYTVYIIMR